MPRKQKVRKISPFLRNLLILVILGIIGSLSWFGVSLLIPRTTESHYTMQYTVSQGETFNEVLKDLESVQIIRSYWAAKIFQSLGHYSLKKGVYEISPNMPLWEIIKTLSVGKKPLVSITFPEGFSLSEIAARLSAKEFSQTKDFLSVAKDPIFLDSLGVPGKSVEGFLFPSTYYVPKDISSQELIKLMVNTFRSKIASLTSKSYSLKDIYQKVILASIIEKEAVVEKDRPLIASVFENRIHKKMRLESCASVIYIFESQGIKKNRVYYKDLQVDSPYNTYKHIGLPPGPISNPGLESLKASFFPAHTPYLFFVYKGYGEHIFSDNYEDHMKAYKQYIQYQNIKKN